MLITEGIQRPADQDERYSCFDCCQSPVQLVTTPDSVLALETGFSPSDIDQLASIAPQLYMCSQAKHCARQLFFARFFQSMSRLTAMKLKLIWPGQSLRLHG